MAFSNSLARRHAALLLLTSLSALAISGCGDDSSPGDDDPLAFDQCLGPADQAILDSVLSVNLTGDAGIPDGGVVPMDGGFTGYGNHYSAVQEVALGCGLSDCFEPIISEEGAETCMYDCYQASALSGLGPSCVKCATETVDCAKNNCVVECFAGELQCRDCLWENCVPRLEECTGLPA